MGFFGRLYPLLRRNSTYALVIASGALIFDQVFNRYTRYFFFDVMNKGKSFSYLEPKILQMQASADDDDE